MIINAGAAAGSSAANEIEYDNSNSGLESTEVQSAIDELKTNINEAQSTINTLDTNLNVKVSSFNSSSGTLALVSC